MAISFDSAPSNWWVGTTTSQVDSSPREDDNVEDSVVSELFGKGTSPLSSKGDSDRSPDKPQFNADGNSLLLWATRHYSWNSGVRIPSTAQIRIFKQLVKIWKASVPPVSSPAVLANHPAYAAIMKMQGAAVPLLLSELSRSPDHWFYALRSITKADPVPVKSRGRIREMAQAWINWGRARGIPIAP